MIFFRFRKIVVLACSVVLAGVLFLTGCQNGFEDSIRQDRLYLVSWNVQTFFDGETSGLEYSEFTGTKSGWDSTKYEKRLKNLCQAIAILDADILVLQEIESTAVMQDIANYLPEYMDRGKSYKWMTFGIEKDAAIGCGVFSRVPLGNTYIHQVDSRIYGEQPQLRPLVEVELLLGDKTPRLFICHWKSKSGSEEKAFLWQKEQELLLADCLKQLAGVSDSTVGDLDAEVSKSNIGDFDDGIADCEGDSGEIKDGHGSPTTDVTGKNIIKATGKDIAKAAGKDLIKAAGKDLIKAAGYADGAVICGDFNRDLEEFTLRNNRVLIGDIPVADGWLHPSVTAEGSYYYKNNWEKIDHIFTWGTVHIESFDALTNELWTIPEGDEIIPHKYTVWKGTGFSDHLPVGAVLRF